MLHYTACIKHAIYFLLVRLYQNASYCEDASTMIVETDMYIGILYSHTQRGLVWRFVVWRGTCTFTQLLTVLCVPAIFTCQLALWSPLRVCLLAGVDSCGPFTHRFVWYVILCVCALVAPTCRRVVRRSSSTHCMVRAPPFRLWPTQGA